MSEQLELFGRPESLTLSEAVDIYWELEGKFKPGHSTRSECSHISRFIGDVYLHHASFYDVQKFFLKRRAHAPSIKESSLNRDHTRITRIFNAYYEWKKIGRVGVWDFSDLKLPAENPGEQIEKSDETKYQRNNILKPEDIEKYLDYAHPRVRRIVTLAILTLLRRKDIQMLTNDNFNRAMNTVCGIQSKTKLPYEVPAPFTVRIIFNSALEEEREYICDFTNFRKLNLRAQRESGVYFHMSDLRKTGATALLLDNVDLRTIQKHLGHGSLKTTEGYLKPPSEVSQEAGRKLERAFMGIKYDVPLSVNLN